ncbi:MAG: hypothetical protein ACOX0E_04525 [Syntrophomonadaceae bacterium]|jgi:hypothetical protein
MLRIVEPADFCTGDLVTVRNMPKSKRFCIIKIKKGPHGEKMAVLKALFNDTYIIEKPVTELISLLIKGVL